MARSSLAQADGMGPSKHARRQSALPHEHDVRSERVGAQVMGGEVVNTRGASDVVRSRAMTRVAVMAVPYKPRAYQ